MRDNFIFPHKFSIGLESFAESIETMLLNEHVGHLLLVTQDSDLFEKNRDQHLENTSL